METTEDTGSGLDAGAGGAESTELDTQDQGQQDTPADQGQQVSQNTADQPQGKLPRQQRRDLWKEKHAAEKEARQQRDENRRLRETIEQLSKNVEKIAPKEPSPAEKAKARLLKAAQALDPKSQASMDEYFDAQREFNLAGKEDEIVQKVLEQVGDRIPSKRPPAVQRILNEFDWAADDENLQEEIALETRRAARRRNVDLKSVDQKVMYALMREGAIAVAKANGLSIPGANGRDTTARDRFTGSGGGRGVSGSGGVPAVDAETRQRILEATSSMGGEYRGKSPEERVAMFAKKHLRT